MSVRDDFLIRILGGAAALAASLLGGCGGGRPEAETADPALSALEAQLARFAPVDLAADVSHLPPSERETLRLLIAASKIIDTLFLEQVWAGNPALLLDLTRDRTPLGEARLRYFILNKGPWSRIDEHEPFVPGVPPKPAGANFYPPDATKEEIDAWLKGLSEADRRRAAGFFTTVRRAPDRRLTIVPYSVEYQGALGRAADLLQQAARTTAQPTLRRFLELRAQAFLSNDYYASDVAWMELDASIEPTIGPYEVYEDGWFNYKAAFESFITLRDDEETAKLARFSAELQDIENHLPIDPRYRNPRIAAMAPIRVVNTVFSAGDANRAVQTAAFNLPNDERVLAEKGAKRVMLRNNQDAKFRMVLVPISRVALTPADQGRVSFDAFFTHILMHELMHGLGPHNIRVNGRDTTVRQELRENSSAIEEAKADVSGLFALQHLVDKGVLDRGYQDTMYTTFLASIFRSLRFGLDSAHGRGVAVQLNYFLDHGGVSVGANGTFAVNGERMRQNVADLTRDIMTLQAVGDHAAAAEMLGTGVIRPPVQAILDRLREVPVDIAPRFVTADGLAGDPR
jgi:hypothetical protein